MVGHETLCAHMAWLLEKTNISHLDVAETIWQINWCEIAVSPPSDGRLRTKDGTRLWVRVTLRDCSSHVTLHMTHNSVLELSSFNSAEEWEAKYADGDFVFPILVSVKIRRIIKHVKTAVTLHSLLPVRSPVMLHSLLAMTQMVKLWLRLQ